jgi:phospholipase C
MTLAQSAPGTPIEGVVVVSQENVSFDQYFATSPNAVNPDGEPIFAARQAERTPLPQ